jgi:hypothetical protein
MGTPDQTPSGGARQMLINYQSRQPAMIGESGASAGFSHNDESFTRILMELTPEMGSHRI